MLHQGRYELLNMILIISVLLFSLMSMIRYFPEQKNRERDVSSIDPYDERDTMFARNNMKYHPELMEQYYSFRPENRSCDEQIHKKPEFGQKRQVYHDFYTAPGYISAFEYLEGAIPLSDGRPKPEKQPVDPFKLRQTIRELGLFYGACDIGFVDLEPHHFYSRKGRHAEKWGEATDQNYKTAISIVVPMRVKMVKKSPTSCMIQESAHKYVEAAKISNIIAGYIRQFGYRARAHNDANYDVICVPVAMEAGLGGLGRHGLFMHKTFGSCVRLAVVTTELSLPRSGTGQMIGMEAFCRICKKCADNCPTRSISRDSEPESRNVRHWTIQQEQCYSYWKTIGSDCGHCISVCPYTKPDTLVHRMVRFYISRNPINQKIALFMDDLLYGRIKKIPGSNPGTIFQR